MERRAGGRDWPLHAAFAVESVQSQQPDSSSTISSICGTRRAILFPSHLFVLRPYAVFLDAAMSGRRVFSMQASAKASTAATVGASESTRSVLRRAVWIWGGAVRPSWIGGARSTGAHARAGALWREDELGGEKGARSAQAFSRKSRWLSPQSGGAGCVPWAVASAWWGTVDLGRDTVYQELLHAAGRTN